MINYSLQDTYELSQSLVRYTIENTLKNNINDLHNLSKNIQSLENVINKEWNIISYLQAKKITQKNDIGLSTEEERFLTVVII